MNIANGLGQSFSSGAHGQASHQTGQAFNGLGVDSNALQLLGRIIQQLEQLLAQVIDGRNIDTSRYRTIDGQGNNLDNPEWGSAESALFRMMDPFYNDGVDSMAGQDRPNARAISNAVQAQDGDTENAKGASDLFWQWGQFIDHDITLVENNDGVAKNIAVPNGDPVFDPFGTGGVEIPFNRSNFEAIDGVREQRNDITSYLDASMIYGSDEETAHQLRSFEGGRLKVDENGLLPTDENGMFLAGDIRANEQTGLTSMHTLWVREHNYWADRLSQQNPFWSDEKVYQEAKRMVTAEIQHITYNEFLPLLVGDDALGAYQGYDPNANASVSNEFSTAAFRFGHTMLSPTIQRLDAEGNTIPEGDLGLFEAFFKPETVREAGIDPVIRGQAEQVAQAIDPMIIDDVRNTLFGPPGSGGMDLAALNIQRGRDHGLPSYNDTREALGLSRIESFDDPIFKGDFGQKLASVYDHPDQVDLWVGGLAEKSDGNAMVGETFKTILVDQFERTRSGDRFWYEGNLTQSELNEVSRTSLSDVIERNSNVEMADDTAMIATDSATNGYVPQNPNNDGLADLLSQVAEVLSQIAQHLGQKRYA